MLIQAGTLRGALDRLEEGMKGSMMDYEVAAINETPIMDIFRYKAPDQATNAEALED